jgi:excisionase family DNA binding protein
MRQNTTRVDNMERKTISVPEFARIVGIGRASAYNAVKRGEVKAVWIGKRVVIPRTELDRVLRGEIQPK